MIVVDPREGSGHLAPMIRKAGCECELRKLEFGDIAFPANGPSGPIVVGVEVKTPTDLITSLVNRRLTSRQLPGMLRCYEECVIAVVGRLQKDETGSIVEGRMGRWWRIPTSLTWRQLEAMKMSLRYQSHVTIVEFENAHHLAEWICVAANWWGREWTSHKSHVQTHVAFSNVLPIYETTHVAQVASLIPGFGIEIGRRVGKRFQNVLEMVQAPRETWEKINGVGRRRAAQAFLWLREKR